MNAKKFLKRAVGVPEGPAVLTWGYVVHRDMGTVAAAGDGFRLHLVWEFPDEDGHLVNDPRIAFDTSLPILETDVGKKIEGFRLIIDRELIRDFPVVFEIQGKYLRRLCAKDTIYGAALIVAQGQVWLVDRFRNALIHLQEARLIKAPETPTCISLSPKFLRDAVVGKDSLVTVRFGEADKPLLVGDIGTAVAIIMPRSSGASASPFNYLSPQLRPIAQSLMEGQHEPADR